jgi:hypothetical protein
MASIAWRHDRSGRPDPAAIFLSRRRGGMTRSTGAQGAVNGGQGEERDVMNGLRFQCSFMKPALAARNRCDNFR